MNHMTDSLVSNPVQTKYCNLLQTSPEVLSDAVAVYKYSF